MKNRHIIFLLMIIIALIGIILSVTYALNINITENTTNDYDLSYTFDISDNATWTINVEPGKTKIYELTLTNPYNDSIKYGIAYKLENPTELLEGITIEVPDTSSSLPQDSLEANNTNNIEVEIKNNSTNNIQITLSILTGYKNGGDLIIPNNYVLLTKEEKYYIRGYDGTDKTFNKSKYYNDDCLVSPGFEDESLACLAEYGDNFLNTDIKKALIYSINVIKTSEIPEGVSNPVDVSKNQDNSVLLYSKVSQNKGRFNSSYDYYDIYIATNNGKVYLSEGYNMFEYLVSLNNIDLSNVYTDDITNMASMFALTMSLTDLDLSNFNTSKVTNMAGAFFEDGGILNSSGSVLKNINISSFDTSNVTDMSYMFSYNILINLDLNNFDTSNVTDMSNMFENNAILTILDISSFDTSKVTNIARIFSRCTNLTTIYASNKFNTSNVASSTDMFYNCPKLVGGNGTKYNSSYTDKTYARIDASGTPGYFTSK